MADSNKKTDAGKHVKAKLDIYLASPRGFCAGVERAIRTVENALSNYGAPVYVRHEIVHNKHVVQRLTRMGAIFIDDVALAKNDRPLILSAHGSPQIVYSQARANDIELIDATCPLVSKVHTQARRLVDNGYHVVLIGHKNHQEVIGTMGQVPEGSMSLIENTKQALSIQLPHKLLAYVTQTTLSVDETKDIITLLQNRFPDIVAPAKADICYATSNRQEAIKSIAPLSDLVIVIGSNTSSNSQKMVDVALENGAKKAILTDDKDSFDWSLLDSIKKIGLSSGASAPEELMEQFLTALAEKYSLVIKTIEVTKESIFFKAPNDSRIRSVTG